MKLSIDQQVVADKFMDFLHDPNINEMTVEGFPGTGKSFLTKYLIESVKNSNTLTRMLTNSKTGQVNIICTATTNKAAVILQELSGQNAQTIHSLLKLKVTNNHNDGSTGIKRTAEYKPIENSLIFIDEYTYIDKKLLKFIRDGAYKCKILFIGDAYQLISIHESSCPVTDQVTYKGILTQPHRFSSNGPIDKLAATFRKAIDTGEFTPIKYDGVTIKHATGTEFQAMIDAEFTHNNIGVSDAKILAWSNNKVQEYNKYVRDRLTSNTCYQRGEILITNKPIVGHKGNKGFAYTTEQMVTIENTNYGEEHGVKGTWLNLGKDVHVFQANDQNEVRNAIKEAAKTAKSKETTWDNYFYLKEFFADLRPIHAATVYKAQGSTYKKVFIDLTNIGKCNQPNTFARMMHVAVSRASHEVICYGELPLKYSGIPNVIK